MTANSILPPYPTFQELDGTPLEAGYIYVGEPGLEARTTPKASFFDIGLTIPTGTASGAAIRTIAGYPARTGSPSGVYVDGDFSITVTDRNGVVLYSALTRSFAFGLDSTIGDPVLAPDGNLSTPGFSFIDDPNTGVLRPSVGTMQFSVLGVLSQTNTATGVVFPLPVSGAGFVSGVAAALDPDLAALGAISGVEGDLIYRNATTWARLPKGTSGKALVMDSGGAIPVWGGIFTKSYESPVTVVALDTLYTFTHGLGGLPKLISAFYVCKLAINGYSVGDYVPILSGTENYNNDVAPAIVISATEIKFRTASGALMRAIGINGATRDSYLPANFDLVVRAYA
jgi:hypothetical protein